MTAVPVPMDSEPNYCTEAEKEVVAAASEAAEVLTHSDLDFGCC